MHKTIVHLEVEHQAITPKVQHPCCWRTAAVPAAAWDLLTGPPGCCSSCNRLDLLTGPPDCLLAASLPRTPPLQQVMPVDDTAAHTVHVKQLCAQLCCPLSPRMPLQCQLILLRLHGVGCNWHTAFAR